MLMMRSIRKRLATLVLLGAATFTLGGCVPSGLGRDLFTSAASAVVGDAVFTLLDFVLPRPT